MEKLKFDVRMAEAEAEHRHSTRRFFLESYFPSNDPDGHLLAFIEEDVVEAEMKGTLPCLGSDCVLPHRSILLGKYCRINWLDGVASTV